MEETMGSIRIIKTPSGFADEHIRAMWVGIVIPLVPEEEAVEAEKDFRPSESSGGFIVSGEQAVGCLMAAELHEAVSFWSRPVPPTYLRFARDCCELIE